MTTKTYESPALYTTPEHTIKMVDTTVPSPSGSQVLVHVRATGVCGSDVHFWKHGKIGSMVVTADCGLGHESSGVVLDVGPECTLFKKGDRVAIEPGVPCGRAECHYCLVGRYNACPTVTFFSTPPVHGLLTRYHLHPQEWLHKLPDSMSFEEGSLLEPLCVALAGIERAELKLGDELLICGAGPIGLVTLLCARAAGASPIAITDISASRLEFAKTLVPTVRTVLISPSDSPEASAARVKNSLDSPLGTPLAIECTGQQSSVHTAIFASRFGGRVFIIGVGRDTMEIPFMHLSANEIDLKFQYRYAHQWPKAIRLVKGGLVNLKPLVTHRYTLEDAVQALECAADTTHGAIKTMIIDVPE